MSMWSPTWRCVRGLANAWHKVAIITAAPPPWSLSLCTILVWALAHLQVSLFSPLSSLYAVREPQGPFPLPLGRSLLLLFVLFLLQLREPFGFTSSPLHMSPWGPTKDSNPSSLEFFVFYIVLSTIDFNPMTMLWKLNYLSKDREGGPLCD